MEKVVGVSFDNNKRVYFFDPAGLNIAKDDYAIVETERGLQYGHIVTSIMEKKKEALNLPLKKVIRIATKEDFKKYRSNIELSKKAMIECQKLINKYGFDIKLMDASFTFNREQLMYHFLSDSRIDFRTLVKDLAAIFKTRIELRQIGVRDKAKEISGLGPCGRILCCSKFLSNFDSVSINMAKNQNISLNPTKINGACGRLLCCLAYENETYDEYRKGLPNLGEKVKYDGKEGKVVSLDILKRQYTFLTDNEEYILVQLNDSTK